MYRCTNFLAGAVVPKLRQQAICRRRAPLACQKLGSCRLEPQQLTAPMCRLFAGDACRKANIKRSTHPYEIKLSRSVANRYMRGRRNRCRSMSASAEPASMLTPYRCWIFAIASRSGGPDDALASWVSSRK